MAAAGMELRRQQMVIFRFSLDMTSLDVMLVDDLDKCLGIARGIINRIMRVPCLSKTLEIVEKTPCNTLI